MSKNTKTRTSKTINVVGKMQTLFKSITVVLLVLIVLFTSITLSATINTVGVIAKNTELYDTDMRCEVVDSFELSGNKYTIVTDEDTYNFEADNVEPVIYRNEDDNTAHYLIKEDDLNYLLIPLNGLYKQVFQATGYVPFLIFTVITLLLIIKLALVDKSYRHPKVMITTGSIVLAFNIFSGLLCFFML